MQKKNDGTLKTKIFELLFVGDCVLGTPIIVGAILGLQEVIKSPEITSNRGDDGRQRPWWP